MSLSCVGRGVLREEILEKKTNGVEWGHFDTVMLLDLYGESLCNIGPMKRFRNKRQMWAFISTELANNGYERTAVQCESRYKTIIKRKKKVDDYNSRPGLEESAAAADESKTCPIRIGVGHQFSDDHYVSTVSVLSPAASSSSPPSSPEHHSSRRRKRQKNDDICETLIKLEEVRERNRKARHEDKMELLRMIFKTDK